MRECQTEKKNVMLCDKDGLGRKLSVIAFLNHLQATQDVVGPYLIIAQKSKFNHWKQLIENHTSLSCLIYHDSDGSEGRDRIRDLCWFKIDLTRRGGLTQSCKIPQFNIIICSPDTFDHDYDEVLI